MRCIVDACVSSTEGGPAIGKEVAAEATENVVNVLYRYVEAAWTSSM
jgi:hypothetical protein